jgi:hypothetical protein
MKVRTELRAGQSFTFNAVAALANIANNVAQANVGGSSIASTVGYQSNTSTITSAAIASATGGTQTAASV